MSRTTDSSSPDSGPQTNGTTVAPTSKPARPRRPPVREEDRTPCPVCERSFSRPEHMYRHLLIHQGHEDGAQQQHVCSICHKEYSRKDALLRHQQTHGPEVADALAASSRLASPDQRRAATRMRKACERCSRMKIRCDGQRPCQKCVGKPALARECSRQVDDNDSEVPLPAHQRLLQSWRARQHDRPSQGSNSQSHQSDSSMDLGYHSDDDVGAAVRRRGRGNRGSPPHLVSALRQPSSFPAPPLSPRQEHAPQDGHLLALAPSASPRRDPSAPSHVGSTSQQPNLPFAPSHNASSTTQSPSSLPLLEHSASMPSSLSMDRAPLRSSAAYAAVFPAAEHSQTEPTSVSFCEEVELISATNPTPSSDFEVNAITPSHHVQLQDFSNLHSGDDILAMSDLEWLFASPGSLPSVGVEDMSDPFGFIGLEYQMSQGSASGTGTGSMPHASHGSVWAPAPQVTDSQGSHVMAPTDNLLDLLAGAASLDVPERRSQNFGQLQPPTRVNKIPDFLEGPRRIALSPSRRGSMTPAVAQSPARASVSVPPSMSIVSQGQPPRKRQRRLEPQDLTAPSRRASPTRQVRPVPSPNMPSSGSGAETVDALQSHSRSSEENTAPTQWPNSWYPEKGPSQTKLDHLAAHHLNATPDIIAEESSCQVPAIDASSVTKLHALADYVDADGQGEHSVRSILKSINVETYDLMLQLFFERFHPRYNFLHQPSFHPATAHPLLLAACCALGCSFSQMPNARQLADYLADTVHSAINITCFQENLHARSLSIIRALCIVSICFGSAGNQRLLEHGEAQRSALATMVRRCHLLEYQPAPDVAVGDAAGANATHEQWQAWLHWEGIKRTSWTCVVADLEFSSAWKVPPIYSLDELRAELPHSDRKWMAPNASLWKSYRSEPSMTLSEAHERLQALVETSGSSGQQGSTKIFTEASLLNSKVLSCTLHLYATSLRAFARNSLIIRALKQPHEVFQNLLVQSCDLAAARHAQHSDPGDGLDNEELSNVSFEQMMHFIHLSLMVDLADVQKLGGRKGTKQANAALLKVHRQRLENPGDADLLAGSCGRIIHLARSYPAVLTYSINIVFYASLYLYAFSKSLQHANGSSDAEVERDSTMAVDVISLDSPGARLQRPHDEGDGSSRTKKRYQLRFVGDLSGPSAPLRILKVYSRMLLSELSQRTPGASAKIFGRVLADLAMGMERQQRLSEINQRSAGSRPQQPQHPGEDGHAHGQEQQAMAPPA